MERLSKMFDEFWPEVGSTRWGWYPKVDVKETDKDLTFHIDLPGMKEENINVEIVGDCLTVCGNREFSKEERQEDYIRLERGFGEFERSFNLNFPVKPENLDALHVNGVLRVTVPKAETVKTHKVPVHHNGK